MQEKKNKRRFVLLIILTIITLAVFWWGQSENQLDIDPSVFQVADLSTISRVELVADTSRVVLDFDGSTWRVNDQYYADTDMIRVLFATLQQARPKRTVARVHEDSIFSQLEAEGVRVSLYAGETLEKQFFAGGNTARTQSFFADPVSRQAYLMTIPGYRVYVSGILALPESGWRDKFVFRFNWRNFKSLEAEFGTRPAENFAVSMGGNYFGIEGLPEADTARLNTFLDNVSLLKVDEYASRPRLVDSLRRQAPLLALEITDIADRKYRVRFYDPGASDQVWGILQDSQLALFDTRKITLLLKPKSFFSQK